MVGEVSLVAAASIRTESWRLYSRTQLKIVNFTLVVGLMYKITVLARVTLQPVLYTYISKKSHLEKLFCYYTVR
jgi:hypothetical protein